jgi:hypothetical protein
MNDRSNGGIIYMGKLIYRKCSPSLKGITFFRSSTNGTSM